MNYSEQLEADLIEKRENNRWSCCLDRLFICKEQKGEVICFDKIEAVLLVCCKQLGQTLEVSKWMKRERESEKQGERFWCFLDGRVCPCFFELWVDPDHWSLGVLNGKEICCEWAGIVKVESPTLTSSVIGLAIGGFSIS